MTLALTDDERLGEPPTERWAVAVADAGWFTTESLFGALDRPEVSTLLLKCMDVRVARQKRLPWWRFGRPLRRSSEHVWEREIILPPGWMKTYPKLGMSPIARAIRGWTAALPAPAHTALVMTYPYYVHLARQLQPRRTLYYNLDDYALYWPHRADEVRAVERRAVLEADVTICVSAYRAEQLRAELPERAARIYHIPHGAPAWSLAPHPHERPADPPPDLAHLPRPLLGYVGSFEDRVDWDLLEAVADAFPTGTLVLIGRPPGKNVPGDWVRSCRRLMQRPNVHLVGWRPQPLLGADLACFDVSLIPYRVDHPFNRACSPTKIMDCMGSTRPVVATSIPECRLYDTLFHVADDTPGFVEAIRAIVARGSDDGLAPARFERARANTCALVAESVVSRLIHA